MAKKVNTRTAIGAFWERANPITDPRKGPEQGVAIKVVRTPEKNEPEYPFLF